MQVNDFERNALMELAVPVDPYDGPPLEIQRRLPLPDVCVRLANKGLVRPNYAIRDARPWQLTLAGQAVLYSGAGGPPRPEPAEAKEK